MRTLNQEEIPMPEGSTTVESEDEPIPFSLPENKYDAGLRISQVGRISRKRPFIEAKYNRRIAKAKKRADELKRERDAALLALDESSEHPAHELTEYLKRCWMILTKNGSTKQISFWSGIFALRNLPDRARVDDPIAFFAEARRKGKAKLLITRGPDKVNLTALNKDLALAASFKTVTIEQKSSLTIRPKHGWGILRAFIPRKMGDATRIEELLGDEKLDWALVPPEDDE